MLRLICLVWAVLLGWFCWVSVHNSGQQGNEATPTTMEIDSERTTSQRFVKSPRVVRSKKPRRFWPGHRVKLQEESLTETDWFDKTKYESIELDTPTTQRVSIMTEEDEIVVMFKIRVPRDAKTMTFAVDELPTAVSMYGLSGSPLHGPEDATDVNPEETFLITISRYDYVAPLQGGWYYFVVVLEQEGLEALWSGGVESLDVTVTGQVNSSRVDGQLEVGTKISSSLSPEVGCFRTFELTIPEGLDSLRLDLDRSNSDLNLAVRQTKQIVNTIFADDYSEDITAREFLVLKREDFDQFDQEKWFVDVYAPYNESFTDFDIYVTAGDQPPEELLELPDLDLELTPAENAMLATVQIGTQSGGGSGTIVSPEGLILTNYHVVSEADHFANLLNDESENDVVVALSTGPEVPPIEYFLATVIEKSVKNDLALLKIKSGYYGQALPADYRFPHAACHIPKNNELGSSIRVCGYPASGSVENNPTFTVSGGILSGFLGDRHIKTDADIASGNSGGAAFDSQWRLIGVPTMTIEDPSGAGPTMGILMSLELIPNSWGLKIE